MLKANSGIFNAKILIIGDSTVGKTSILIRWARNLFSLNHRATIGVDFHEKLFQISGKNINVQIWDTAGQERFRNMTKTFYQGAMGIILAYDCTSEVSFNNIHNWIQQIYTHASLNICKILIGNKSDLPEHIITKARGAELANEFGMKFFETSAKNDTNIQEAFLSLIEDVANKHMPIRDSIRISRTKKSYKCCHKG